MENIEQKFEYKKYSKEELTRMLKLAKTCIDARDEIMHNYKGMILGIAKSFTWAMGGSKRGQGITSIEDYIQEGYIALARAIETFKPKSANDCNPNTYIYRSINTALVKFKDISLTENKTHGTKVPRNLGFRMLQLDRLVIDNPDRKFEELAEEFRLSIDPVIGKESFYSGWSIYNASRISLNLELNSDTQISDVFNLPNSEDNYSHLDEKYKPLIEAVDLLPDREKLVIIRRYVDEKSLQEVGEELGVSRERARQIQNKAEARVKRLTKKIL